jgi:RHS repeat-associated protein
MTTLKGFSVRYRNGFREVVFGRDAQFNASQGYCANLGHQEDETGFIYMRARYYEPATGRFISEDPARDGVNWYLYADGNAVNRVDYNGCETELEWAAYGAFFAFSAVLHAVYGIKSAEAGRAAEAISWAFRSDLLAAMSVFCYFKALGGNDHEARLVFAVFGSIFTGVANRWVGKVLDDILKTIKLGTAHGVNAMATIAIGASIGYSFALIAACLLSEAI